ncbi:hypothetical protein XENOCAPTIV_001588, partial [Xenoophorus captivus]
MIELKKLEVLHINRLGYLGLANGGIPDRPIAHGARAEDRLTAPRAQNEGKVNRGWSDSPDALQVSAASP